MNRRILCVDDEEAILKALRLHVRKGFEMSRANSGAEGLEVFEKELAIFRGRRSARLVNHGGQ